MQTVIHFYNSEFKPALLRLKTDIVSHAAWAKYVHEGNRLLPYTVLLMFLFWEI